MSHRGGRRFRSIAAWAAGVSLLSALTGCGSPNLTPTPVPATEESSPVAQSVVTPSPTGAVPGAPCSSGKLLIGDLPEIDAEWRAGLEAATAKATEWQQDAVLSNLRIVCQIFEADFRWQATFYSQNAQAFFSSDTGETEPSSVEQDKVPRLNIQQLSFAMLHETLNDEGYGDEIEISPSSGVDIRLNTVDVPFGPPDAPDNIILYHVAIERLGEVRDVFIDAATGQVYIYSM